MKIGNVLIALGVAVVLLTSGYVFGSMATKRHALMRAHFMGAHSAMHHRGPMYGRTGCHGYHKGACGHKSACSHKSTRGHKSACGHKMGGCKKRMGGKCHKSSKYAGGKSKKHHGTMLWDLNRDGRISPGENTNFALRRFYTHDRDSDGVLSLEEFAGGKKSRHHARVEEMFGRLDANGDNALELEEARAAARQHFRDADRDGDGYLDRQEKKLGLMALYGMDTAELFQKADRNEDGALSREEFQEWVQPRRSRRAR